MGRVAVPWQPAPPPWLPDQLHRICSRVSDVSHTFFADLKQLASNSDALILAAAGRQG